MPAPSEPRTRTGIMLLQATVKIISPPYVGPKTCRIYTSYHIYVTSHSRFIAAKYYINTIKVPVYGLEQHIN